MKAMYLLIALLIAPLISNSQGAYEKYGLSYDGKGNLLEGRYILTTEEEQTVIVYQFNKGLLHGEFMIYAFNGNIIERGNYFVGNEKATVAINTLSNTELPKKLIKTVYLA